MHQGTNDVKITLWKDGVLVGLIIRDINPTLGVYNWNVGDYSGGTALSGIGYKIKIREQGGESFITEDLSDTSFNISNITIVSPNGGESLGLSTNHNITWNASWLLNDVKITLWKDGVLVGLIVRDINPTLGVYNWNVGDYSGGTASFGSGYKIKIREQGGANFITEDLSDTPFSINDPSGTQSSMLILNPSGNEEYTKEISYLIRWDVLSNTEELVKIDLFKDDIIYSTISNSTENDGYYLWNISSFFDTSSNYKIKIKNADDYELSYSNSFTISSFFNPLPHDTKVHAWYYIWYDNAGFHWNQNQDGNYEPNTPINVGAGFFPQRGTYDSLSDEIIHSHAIELKRAGIGVAIISWWKGERDWSDIRRIMQIFSIYGIQSTIAIEPGSYNKDPDSDKYFPEVILEINHELYQEHYWWKTSRPTLYGRTFTPRAVFYVWDSFNPNNGITLVDWLIMLNEIRLANPERFIILGHGSDSTYINTYGGFDGLFTYDGYDPLNENAADSVSKDVEETYKCIFEYGVSPGYDDRRAMIPNAKGERDRENGGYFRREMDKARGSTTEWVSIVSFNEWHEGTQIEPCIQNPPVPTYMTNYNYNNYGGTTINNIPYTGSRSADVYIKLCGVLTANWNAFSNAYFPN